MQERKDDRRSVGKALEIKAPFCCASQAESDTAEIALTLHSIGRFVFAVCAALVPLILTLVACA